MFARRLTVVWILSVPEAKSVMVKHDPFSTRDRRPALQS